MTMLDRVPPWVCLVLLVWTALMLAVVGWFAYVYRDNRDKLWSEWRQRDDQ